MQRSLTWDTKELHAFLLARASVPFQWGGNDCALFAADAIEAMTGVDIAGDFRGKYSDEAGAFALIKEITGGSTVLDAAAYCASKYGLVRYEYPLMARRGDLVVAADEVGFVSGIIHLNGRHVVVAGEQGLKRLPIAAVKRAWSV